MIHGDWSPANSSARQQAELLLADESFSLYIDSKVHLTGAVTEMQVSDRVGNIPRKLTLPDGSLFQTQANDQIDQWLKQHRTQHKKRSKNMQHSAASGLFHRLESSWPLILFSVMFVIAFTSSLLKWGLPWASERVAYALPEVVAENVGKHTLETLDATFLTATQLAPETQDSIKQRFTTELAPLFDDKQGYDVHFRQIRHASDLANAFALPSGDIIVTDALVERLGQGQLDSVLLHEIGHVYHRHGMRRIVHNSSLVVLLTAMFGGDLSLGEELIVGFPVFLMHQHYSREAEIEADAFAMQHMQRLGLDPIEFAQALEIITADETDAQHEGADAVDYLSTHPATAERIEQARQLSLEFNR